MILCTLIGNMWAGIGGLFGIVIGLISKAGSSFFGNLGLFSFSSCEVNQLMSESYDTPLNEVSFDVIDFDRSCCFKEVFTG